MVTPATIWRVTLATILLIAPLAVGASLSQDVRPRRSPLPPVAAVAASEQTQPPPLPEPAPQPGGNRARRDTLAAEEGPAATDWESQLESLRLALIRLPVAALLSAILAFRPRRRGTPVLQAHVIQTQIILAVVGAIVMLVVGASLARAFGIVGRRVSSAIGPRLPTRRTPASCSPRSV